MKREKINLDIEILRGVAIIMVMVQHLPSLFFWSSHETFTRITNYLTFWSGVDLFFCISGYVVGKTLINRMDERNKYNISAASVIKEFFIKRAFRLLPVSLFWVAIVLILSRYYNISGAFGIFNENIKQALSILTYNYNWYIKTVNESGNPPTFAPYWSLNLEEQFYFVFPFFLLLVNKKYRIFTLLAIIAFLFFIKRQGFLSFNFRIDAICYGVILAIVSDRESYRKPADWIRRVCKNPVIALSLTIALLILIPRSMWEFDCMVGILAIVSMFAVYLASFNEGFVSVSALMKNIFIYIGSRSYGFYLIHMPAIYFVQESTIRYYISIGRPPSQSLALSICMLIACLIFMALAVEASYRFIEVPIRNYGRKIASGFKASIARQA